MSFEHRGDQLSGIILSGFGILVISEATALPYVSEFGPGPGFLPLWIGIGITACSLAALVVSFFRAGKRSLDSSELSRIEIIRGVGSWAAFVVSIALLPLIGFGLSLGLLSVFLIIALDRRSPWVALGVALFLALGFHLVFNLALGVSLPVGPLGF